MEEAEPDEPARQLLFGRDGIWARLREHLTAARSGRGRVVWLSGEAGIGKTRLLSELDHDAASEGSTILHGTGWEDPGTPPFWVWTQVLREATARRPAADLEAAWGLRVRDALRLLPEFGVGGRVPAEEGTTARFPLFDAFAAVVTGLADERPVVLLLDDLHWTDPGSLRLLQFLESTIARLPVLVVGTWRDHEVATDTELGVLATQIATRSDHIAVRGLASEAVAQLVTAAGGIDVDPGLATRLTERTGGNPLFVTELSRLARDRGTQAVLEAMPGTAQAIIRRRLARISQSCHDLLSLAAVAGTATSLDVIARLAGREPEAIVGDVDEAVEAGLVAIGSGRVEIAHPLIRDGLISALPARRAREIHLDVAHLLTPLLVADPTMAAEIAQHLILALPLGRLATRWRWGRGRLEPPSWPRPTRSRPGTLPRHSTSSMPCRRGASSYWSGMARRCWRAGTSTWPAPSTWLRQSSPGLPATPRSSRGPRSASLQGCRGSRSGCGTRCRSISSTKPSPDCPRPTPPFVRTCWPGSRSQSRSPTTKTGATGSPRARSR